MNFDGYNKVPASYVPNNLGALLPNREIVAAPLEIYNVKNELIGFYWKYGDSIKFRFYTEGTVELDNGSVITAEEFLKDKTMKIQFYNFRYDVVKTAEIPAATKVDVIVSPEESAEVFLRGVYRCSVTIMDGNVSLVTTFEPDTGTLYVK